MNENTKPSVPKTHLEAQNILSNHLSINLTSRQIKVVLRYFVETSETIQEAIEAIQSGLHYESLPSIRSMVDNDPKISPSTLRTKMGHPVQIAIWSPGGRLIIV